VWEYLVDLVRRLDPIEAQRSGRSISAIAPTPEELAEFLEDEQAVGLDRREGKG
jgi:hypothetical protein